MRIAIITPSRMKPSTLAGKSGQYFLEHAVESANSQELDRPATIHFFVGADPETRLPDNGKQAISRDFSESDV